MKINYRIPAFIILTVVICTMCKEPNHSETGEFDWLLGKWQRTNEEQDKDTYENWTKTNDFLYSGIGFTMMNGDTVKQERIRIQKKKDNWQLMVKVPEERQWVFFNLLSISDSSFSFENDTIDFPKLITYRKVGENIKARVSGDELEIDFEFSKME